MTLAQTWSRFIAGPKIDALSDDATLTYVTSCKQFKGAKAIIGQLNINAEGLKSVKDEVIASHESQGSLINEVAASFVLEFDGKSNPFLPGIDDNMYSGRKVEVPMIWIVNFAGEKIHDVRVFWDQATVLKQIDVIGARGRGWPVFDGAEQNRFLRQATKPVDAFVSNPTMVRERLGNATCDPHATLATQEVPVEERGEYGAQSYDAPMKPPSRDYNELFIDDSSARPDALSQRQGQGQQRQVTLGQHDVQAGVRQMNLNESRGHAMRNSHFEFGTPDPNDSSFQKNEIPGHQKGAIRDHNRSTEDDEFQHLDTKARPDLASHLDFATASPTPAVHNAGRRGPPQPSFDAFNEHNGDSTSQDEDTGDIHGRDGWNKGRRAPPQSQYDFVSGEDSAPSKQPLSRAASAQHGPKSTDEDSFDIHGRDGYNKGRRAPPQSQYDFVSGEDSAPSKQPLSRAASAQHGPQAAEEESFDMHGRDGWNKARRAPPSSQYDFVSGLDNATDDKSASGRDTTRPGSRDSQGQDYDLHGRDGWNKGRRAPPQSQYDFMSAEDSGTASQQPMSRAASAQYAQRGDANNGPDYDLHGRDGWNKGRRAPPQSQYDLVGDSAAQAAPESFGRTSSQRFASNTTEAHFDLGGAQSSDREQFGRATQRNFTPSYDLGDPEPENIHGRTHNMSRRGPPAPSSNFLG